MVAAGLAAGSTFGLVGALAVSSQGGLLVASGGQAPATQNPTQVLYTPGTVTTVPAAPAPDGTGATGGTDPTVAVPTTTAPPVTVTTAPPVTQSSAS